MDYHDLRERIAHEFDQQHQAGYDVSALRREWDSDSRGWGDHELQAFFGRLTSQTPADPDRVRDEPSELAQIEALWTPDPTGAQALAADLDDRMLAAWRGRVAGNMLGKPVEEGVYWTRARLRAYTQEAGAWPLTDYLPAPNALRQRYQLREDNWFATTLGNIDGSCRDDDVDYTILGLGVLEEHGFDFTSADIAQTWLFRLPYNQTYTAERMAYRNLVNGAAPPESAMLDNPFREWIGALIRADIFGYVSPGDPRRAAELAYRDARVSHVANGIYGEQWAAALVAAAFTAGSAREALDRARCYVPTGSRTAEALDAVTASFDSGASWDDTLEDADRRWAGYHWVHTVNNVAVIAAGLLYGDGDFSRSIALTVLGGLDTDSNGATAGSVAGILAGTSGIGAQWTAPLHDRVSSAVFGSDETSITELARRTLAVVDRGR